MIKSTLLVLKHELITTVARRSFLLTLILLPLAGFAVTLVISAVQKNDAAQGIAQALSGPPTELEVQGFVDSGQLVKEIPASLEKRLQRYPDKNTAAKALANGEIKAYYIISPDYVQTGEVDYVRSDFNPLGGIEQADTITNLLNQNLLEGSSDLIDRIRQPANIQVEYLAQQPQRDPTSAMTFFLPYVVTFLFYIVIMSAASLLLNSITHEKENRVLEILMTSIRPIEMLTGKIIALGLVGLLQTVVWGGAGLLLLRVSGRTLNLSAAFQLPVSVLLWGILFFLFGYAVYASLMAGVGALVPNLREASQATIVIIIPLLIPLMLISALIQSPDSVLSIVLSIFPLTAPVAMMTRLAATSVPAWQPLLALVLLALTAGLVVRSVARMFQAQNLLSGHSFSVALFIRSLLTGA